MIEKTEIRNSLIVQVAAFFIIIAGLIFISSIVTMLLMALFISIICGQPVDWLRKRKVPSWLSIAIVFITILVIFIVLGGIVGNTAVKFTADAAEYRTKLTEISLAVINYLNSKGIEISPERLNDLFDPIKIMNYTIKVLGDIGSIMGNMLLIFFIAIFLLIESRDFSSKIMLINKGSLESLDYLSKIIGNIRHYLTIMTLISLSTGLLVYTYLSIIGVQYAILWALLAFLLNFIPNIGSIIAAIPAVTYALLQGGFIMAIWTLIGYILINIIVGNMLTPRFLGKGLGLSTLVAFLSFIFWGYVLGTVGMFLSVPLTMAIKIMLEQNPNTKWIALLLGTKNELESYNESPIVSEDFVDTES